MKNPVGYFEIPVSDLDNNYMSKKYENIYTFSTLDEVDSIALSADGKILACAQSEAYTLKEQFINVFDIDTKQQICYFEIGRRGDIAEEIIISPSKKEIVWRISYKITIGTLTTGECIHRIYDKDIGRLLISNEEKLIGISTKIAKAFDLKTGEEIHSLITPTDSENFILLSSNGNLIISLSESNIILVREFTTGKLLNSFTIKLKDFYSGKELRSFKSLTKPIKCASISSDNKILATVNCNDTITLWDLWSGTEIHTVQWRPYKYHDIIISPTCKYLISFSPHFFKQQPIAIRNFLTMDKITRISNDNVIGQNIILSSNEKTLAYATRPMYRESDIHIKVWKKL